MAAKYEADRYWSLRGLYLATCVLIWISIGLSVVAIGSNVLQLEMLNRLAAGGNVSNGELEFNDIRQAGIGFARLMAMAVSGFVFLWFLGRMSHNAWWLSATPLRFTPVWAVVWFFVPILNLVRPFEAIQELWKVSGTPNGTQNRSSVLVTTWWIGRLLLSFVGLSVMSFLSKAEPAIEDLVYSTYLNIGVFAFDALVDGLLLLVAKGLYDRLETWHAAGGARSTIICTSCGEPLDGEMGLTHCPVCGVLLGVETPEPTDIGTLKPATPDVPSSVSSSRLKA